MPRYSFAPPSNSSYSRLVQVAGEPAAGARGLDFANFSNIARISILPKNICTHFLWWLQVRGEDEEGERKKSINFQTVPLTSKSHNFFYDNLLNFLYISLFIIQSYSCILRFSISISNKIVFLYIYSKLHLPYTNTYTNIVQI